MKRRNFELGIGETKTFYQSEHRHFVVHKKIVMALGVRTYTVSEGIVFFLIWL